MPANFDIEWEMEYHKNELEEFKAECEKANASVMPNNEILIYKEEIFDIIPKELELSFNHLKMMKYWETSNIKKQEDLSNVLFDFAGIPKREINKKEKIVEWRIKYLAELLAASKRYEKLTIDLKKTTELINMITSQYAIDAEHNPYIDLHKKALSSALKTLFGSQNKP